MRDWEAYVRERLGPLGVSPEREADIVRELAQQLDQIYAEAITTGIPEPEALRKVAAHIPDWTTLARDINDAERPVPDALEHDSPRLLAGIQKDVQHTLRVLKANPAFAAIAIFTLAFGIGANTAVFTVANVLVLRPLPYPKPEQLVTLETRKTREPELEAWTSAPDFFDLRKRVRSLSALAGVSPVWSKVMTGRGTAERLECLYVSAEFFGLLGVKPVQGRVFLPEEDQGTHGSNVAIVSHAFSRSWFGGNGSAMGQKLVLDGAAYVIVGILPPGFRYLGEPLIGTASDIDVWLPLGANAIVTGPRTLRFLKLIGRIQPGIGLQHAAMETRAAGAALASEYPDSNRGFEMSAQSFTGQVTGRIRPAMNLLLGAVGLVLLMVCANVANLLLAHTAARQREISIRIALGASRVRLLRQLFTETLILAMTGGLAGVLLAGWTLKVIMAMAPVGLIRRGPMTLDVTAIAFAMFAVLTSAVLSTMPLAWTMMRSEIAASLKEHGRSLTPGNRGFRLALVVAQMALALILVIGAGLLIRSFVRLMHVDPGFQVHHLVTIGTQMPLSARKPEQRFAAYRAISERLLSIPGVKSVGAVSRLPLMGSNLTSWIHIEGRTFQNDEKPEVEYRVATPTYFATMGIPLLQGRLFDERDDSNAGVVALVNEAAARRFWPNGDAIGKHIKLGSGVDQQPWITVIGVVGNTRHFGLETQPHPETYRPYAYNPLGSPNLVIRTAGDPTHLMTELAGAVRSINPEVPAYNVFRMEQLIERSTAERRFVMWLLTAFGVAALFLAAVGIYGVMSQSVLQRTQEIGLRLALGARPGMVQRMVLRQGLVLAGAGAIIGSVASAAFARFMNSLLFGVGPFDAPVFLIATLTLLAVAVLACWAPALRATRVDPLIALRHD